MLHVPGRGGRREKMVNKYAAIGYIRLNASMIKQKKNKTVNALNMMVNAANFKQDLVPHLTRI